MGIDKVSYNPDEISEEVKEKIRIFEELKMGKAQVAKLILVLLGLKPATELSLYKTNDEPEVVIEKVRSAGLVIKNKDVRQDRKKKVIVEFAVARDEATADQLMEVASNQDHEEYGKLMGFPQTAIDAFSGKIEALDMDDRPDMKGIIFSFRMSKDHASEEFELLKIWSEAIKRYSPNTYAALLNN